MKLHNVKQGSDEWHSLRLGRMTASNAHTISVAGKGLETYCRMLAAEIYTGQREDEYKSPDMIRGNEEEDYARSCYEFQTGNQVIEVGFAEYSEYVGASPDGLVGLDGGIEIKRKTLKTHNDLLLGAVEFEEKYIWQCHMCMLIFDREWWDLMSYNPLFKERSLFIKRIHRSAECDTKLLSGFMKGEALINEFLKKY